MTDIVDLKRRIKLKKPCFIRQDAHKQKKLAKVWRKPKGKTNKVRQRKRGYVRMVETGWKSPREVRGFLSDRKKQVVIKNIQDIETLNKKTDSAVLAKNLGAKKKILIIEELKKRGFMPVNLDTEKYLKKLMEKKEEKKKKQERKQQEQKKKKEMQTKQKQEKSPDQEDSSEEEQKKKEKEEKDKVLTKRE